MANFNININAPVDNGYTVTSSLFYSQSNCVNPFTGSILLGIWETTSSGSLQYLLQSYTRIFAPATLKFKNIVYSDSAHFYLEDGAGQVPEAGATVYDLDVVGVGSSAPIPDLTIKLDELDFALPNYTITFDLAVTSTDNVTGTYEPCTIFLQRTKCREVPEDTYLLGPKVEGNCSTTQTIDIAVPLEEERRVVILPSDVFGSPTVDEVITPATAPNAYNLEITGNNQTGTSTTSDIVVLIYASATSTTVIGSYLLSRNHSGAIC
jgi:hypothetical protein